jgi:hypothetical protein
LRLMTEQPQPTPTPKERRLWNLNRDEQQILLITFAAGVGSIVVGAALVGLAIAFARWEAAYNEDQFTFLGWATVVITALFPLVIKIRARIKPIDKPPFTFLLISMCVMDAVLLLVWIGLAAGIH